MTISAGNAASPTRISIRIQFLSIVAFLAAGIPGVSEAGLSAQVDASVYDGSWTAGTFHQIANSQITSSNNLIEQTASGTATYYGSTSSGYADASAQADYQSLESSATSSNTSDGGGYLNDVNAFSDATLYDNLTFTGSGQATFHYSLTGFVSNVGYGTRTPYIYSPQAAVTVSTYYAGGLPDSSFAPLSAGGGEFVITTSQNAYLEYSNLPQNSVIDSNSSFNYQWTTTLSYDNGESIPFVIDLSSRAQDGGAQASLRLLSVDLSPGSSVTDSTGDISYVSPVPETNSYAMLLAGLGLIGVVTQRRRGSSGS